MIVVDPSVLMAIIRAEDEASAFERFLRDPGRSFVISTASFVEAFISSERRFKDRPGGREMERLCQTLLIQPVPFDVTQMAWAVEGYERFGRFGIGRGKPPAVLNLGDCFSYGLAKAKSAPLLFKRDNFSRTDIVAAVPASEQS